MLPSWLRRFARTFTPTSPPPYRHKRYVRKLDFEQFEDRVVPATITWTNAAGGSWQTAANWDLGRLPIAGDDVVIPDLGAVGANLSITNANPAGINHFTTWENVTVSGASIRLRGDLAINGGATVVVSNANLDFEASSAAVVQNVTTTGGGTISLQLGGDITQYGTAHTVVFGSGVTVQALSQGFIGTTSSGRPSGTWTNEGNWTVDSGGTLTVAGNWTNTGAISVNGGTLNLGGTFTQAALGTLNRSGGTVNLTGALTGDLSLTPTTGSWNFGGGGFITNGTITVDPAVTFTQAGLFTFDAVTIGANSTVVLTSSGSSPLSVTNGLTVNGTVQLGNTAGTAGGILTAAGTMTIAGTGIIQYTNVTSGRIDAGGTGSTLTLGPDLTLRGRNITVRGASNSTPTGNTVVIQSDVVPTSSGGTVTLGQYGELVTAGTIEGFSGAAVTIAASSWSNTGTVNIPTGATFNTGSIPWSSTGSFAVTGGTLNLGGSFTSASVANFTRTGGAVNLTGTIDNTGRTLALDPANNGLGTLNMVHGTIRGGTVTAANGALITVTNNSQPSAAANFTDGVVIAAGVEIHASSGNAAIGVIGGLTLNGRVIVNGGFNNGLFFQGTQTLSGTGEVRFAGGSPGIYNDAAGMTLTIGPDITINNAGAGGAIANWSGASGTVINQGTITNTAGTLTIAPSNFTNAAPTTTPATPGGRIHVSGGTVFNGGNIQFAPWTNAGTVNIAGGTLTFSTITSFGNPVVVWSNPGIINLTSGTFNMGGVFSSADLAPGRITRTNGTAGAVNLTGTMVNTNQTLVLDAANNGLGSLNLAGGTISGGTVTAANGGQLLANRNGGYLTNGVTIAAGTDLLSIGDNGGQNAPVFVTGGLTLNGRVIATGTINNAGLYFRGTQTLSGTGEMLITGAAGLFADNVSGTTVTIGPSITITNSGTGVLGNSEITNGTIINQGTITNAAGTLTIAPTSFVNQGTVSATGGTLAITAPTWTNTGTLAVTAGTLNLGGSFTSGGLGL